MQSMLYTCNENHFSVDYETLTICLLVIYFPLVDPFVQSLIQADGDLEDLEQALGKKEVRHMFGSGSCSALIKVLPGNKDLYISQVTWTSYAQLLRVFKLYDVPFTVSGSKGACENDS